VSYYNTTKLRPGNGLEAAAEAAESQNRAILRFFGFSRDGHFTPDQIWAIRFGKKIPITSVRRSISDLTRAGYLEKTKHLVMGIYGRPVHLWRVKDE